MVTKKEDKTVAITLRFWTDGVSVQNGNGASKKRACWSSGNAYTKSNKTLGIKPVQVMFNSMEDIVPAIKKILRANKVLMVSTCSA